MKKFAVICGLLALCAFVGCDDDKNTNTNTKDPTPSGSVSLDITSVPAAQNNTKGAACDYNTFVESCIGSDAVWCGEDASGNSVVEYSTCESSCIITSTSDKLNFATCPDLYEADFDCAAEGMESYACGYDYYGFLGQDHLRCQKWSDGKLHWYAIGGSYCTTCTDTANGCVLNNCTGNEGSCSADGGEATYCEGGYMVTMACYEDEECEEDDQGAFCY
ncbi:MAG: hypothetical protein IKY83_12190 [Proteobacteria bacterium]|nr:hypothetical protein [Pseudomonadota bacterium]